MGLFKNKEEKQAIKDEKMKKFLEDKGISNMDAETLTQIQKTGAYSFSNTLTEIANSFSMDNYKNMVNDSFNTLVNQNWILIKQNDDMKKQNAEIIELLKGENK